MKVGINENDQKLVFTDLVGAIDEAHFMSEKNGRKYLLIQLILGGIHVVASRTGIAGDVIYSTHRDNTHKSNLWSKTQELTLSEYHRGAV